MSDSYPQKVHIQDRRFEPHTCVLRLVREKVPVAADAKLVADAARHEAAKHITRAAAAHQKRKGGGLKALRARIVSSARSAVGRPAPAPPPPVRSTRREFQGPERYLIQFTTNRDIYDKLALASVLLGDRKSPAPLEEVVCIAVEALFDGVL